MKKKNNIINKYRLTRYSFFDRLIHYLIAIGFVFAVNAVPFFVGLFLNMKYLMIYLYYPLFCLVVSSLFFIFANIGSGDYYKKSRNTMIFGLCLALFITASMITSNFIA